MLKKVKVIIIMKHLWLLILTLLFCVLVHSNGDDTKTNTNVNSNDDIFVAWCGSGAWTQSKHSVDGTGLEASFAMPNAITFHRSAASAASNWSVNVVDWDGLRRINNDVTVVTVAPPSRDHPMTGVTVNKNTGAIVVTTVAAVFQLIEKDDATTGTDVHSSVIN
jgi:hypothetical protein